MNDTGGCVTYRVRVRCGGTIPDETEDEYTVRLDQQASMIFGPNIEAEAVWGLIEHRVKAAIVTSIKEAYKACGSAGM